MAVTVNSARPPARLAAEHRLASVPPASVKACFFKVAVQRKEQKKTFTEKSTAYPHIRAQAVIMVLCVEWLRILSSNTLPKS